MVYIISGVLIASCKESRNDTVTSAVPVTMGDTIMLSFFDPDPVSSGKRVMAIFYKGVEEDITSVFRDTNRIYYLGNRNYLRFTRAKLSSGYYTTPIGRLWGAVYQKGLGYSRGFPIELSKSINQINIKWELDNLPGVPKSLMESLHEKEIW